MTTVYATWQDVVDSYEGQLPSEQRPRVEALLRRASGRLTQLVPSLPSRLAVDSEDPVDPEIPAGLVIDAVLRLVRNPAGAQQQTAGPFNQSFGGGQRADVWFDVAQVQELLAPTPAGAGYGTFRLAVPTRPDRRYLDPLRLPLP